MEECLRGAQSFDWSARQDMGSLPSPPLSQGDKMNKGWECPKCGRVYAPSVTECYLCAPVSEPFVPKPYNPWPTIFPNAPWPPTPFYPNTWPTIWHG